MGRHQRRSRTFYIGIYIGKMDLDVAAWFNMLRAKTSISFPKWIHYLLAAEVMGEDVDIGAIKKGPQLKISSADAQLASQRNTIRFGEGSTVPGETKKTNKRVNPAGFKYGWDVRGPDGSFIYGSTISISISTPETIELINKVWKNGRQFSTFLKALIRKHLSYEPEDRAPSESEFLRICDQYLIAVTPQPYDPKKVFEVPVELPDFKELREKAQKGAQKPKETIQEQSKVPVSINHSTPPTTPLWPSGGPVRSGLMEKDNDTL